MSLFCEPGLTKQFMEVQAQHAFIRDESSKGRWDAALSRSLFGMMMESFNRNVARDLGPRKAGSGKIEHVC
jgi:carboxymethylenebutenolidase